MAQPKSRIGLGIGLGYRFPRGAFFQYNFRNRVDAYVGLNTIKYQFIGSDVGLRVYPYNKNKWMPYLGAGYISNRGNQILIEVDNSHDARYYVPPNKFLCFSLGLSKKKVNPNADQDHDRSILAAAQFNFGFNYLYSLTNNRAIFVNGTPVPDKERRINRIILGGLGFHVTVAVFFGR